jgi:hypothetical protein
MDHFAGLDVSVKETSVCVVDDTGRMEMVMAQGLGDEDRQAPRAEKGDCGFGASTGRDHAPHMG